MNKLEGSQTREVKEGIGKLLYIHPKERPSNEAVIDSLTKKVTAALRRARVVATYRGKNTASNPKPEPAVVERGVHTCTGKECQAVSDNNDYVLPNGTETNSLAIHYLAYHRSEVPQPELDKVTALNFGEAEPTKEELQGGTTIDQPTQKTKKEEPVWRGS